MYRLTTDGAIDAEQGQASGPAAIGIVLKNTRGRLVSQYAEAIGHAPDHHVAEYRALIKGLEIARAEEANPVRAFVDSALVANQVNGDWKCDADHLKPLLAEVRSLLEAFDDVKVSWVPREMNSQADELASQILRPDDE